MRLMHLPLLFICGLAHAQGSSFSAPDGCFLKCKTQWEFVSDYDNFTPEELLRKNFGAPRQVGKGQKFTIERYAGDMSEFMLIRQSQTQEVVAVGVIGEPEKLKYARIPFMHMINDQGVIASLADLPVGYLASSCGDGFTEPDARYGYSWTSNCYFGRPARYKNYRFLFSTYECGLSGTGKEGLKELKCPKEAPTIVLAADEEPSDELVELVSSFIYWREIE